jgi:hypothetical protein
MTYNFEIKEEARIEIIEAYIYYESQQTGLGVKFTEQLEKYLHILAKNPLLYPIKDYGFREAYIIKFPFLIIYEVSEDMVVIYSVFNTYRNPDNKP